MDEKLVDQLAQEIKNALQPIIEKHNFKLQFGESFDLNSGWYRPKFILRTIDIDDKEHFLLHVCIMEGAK